MDNLHIKKSRAYLINIYGKILGQFSLELLKIFFKTYPFRDPLGLILQ